jgi:hypothetical protein
MLLWLALTISVTDIRHFLLTPAWIILNSAGLCFHDITLALKQCQTVGMILCLASARGLAVPGKSVSVFIAGDLHHYRRHAAADGTQKITAGGSGAFLHPTHGHDVATLQEEDKHRQRKRTFHLRQSFPDPATSRRLCWRNLLFPYYNPTFGLLTSILYVLTVWAVLPDLGALGLLDVGLAATTILRHVFTSPVATGWLGAVCLGFVLFTDTHSRLYRGVMGPIHGLMHAVAACGLG